MSAEHSAADQSQPSEPVDAPPRTEPTGDPEPTDVPGGTPEGLGSERIAAPFTSETKPQVQGLADALGNTGIDESEKSDPV
jgi:hypothetical protein